MHNSYAVLLTIINHFLGGSYRACNVNYLSTLYILTLDIFISNFLKFHLVNKFIIYNFCICEICVH